eukprot:CAMPEP_0194294832 /NCGR_PEP_ID=MMETSP0169-20130528/51818_1 /TAXON_ID=218684 /ORGANISM="Corethron pennatum, Strain L29A3" /LENGTH=61 /DNA_ID=CAMNT_0039043827 /DNA_START=27 /DNA_END=209 /DNA_ORIENTATION=+
MRLLVAAILALVDATGTAAWLPAAAHARARSPSATILAAATNSNTDVRPSSSGDGANTGGG